MSFGIKPLGTRVVMKRFEAEEKTQGGIILSGQAKEQPQMAEIVAAGPDVYKRQQMHRQRERIKRDERWKVSYDCI